MRSFFIALTVAALGVVGVQPSLAMSCDNRANKDKFHYGSQVQGSQVRICAEWWLDLPKTKPVNSKPLPKPKVDPFSFVVTPIKPRAYTYVELPLKPGQEFALETSAAVHQRSGELLGKAAIVRFTPMTTTWSFGDGRRARANEVLHSYAKVGRYAVVATVAYAVKFRFRGTTRWLADPRGIALETNRLVIPVVGAPVQGQARVPRLVNFDCRNFQYLGC